MGPRQHDQRRANLLDAAASLFAKKGVAATSIEDIVKRAGVAKGTFYHYFRDRSAMLEALRECYSKRFAELAEAAMETCASHDWDERLIAWINAVVLELRHQPCIPAPQGYCGWRVVRRGASDYRSLHDPWSAWTARRGNRNECRYRGNDHAR